MARSLVVACGLILCSAAQAAPADEPLTMSGRLDAVTVYRGQALVTRTIDLPGPAGLRELIVTDLPEQVMPGSLYAESADGVQVRSVLYRQRPVTQDVREEVRKLDAQIRAIHDQLAGVAQQASLLSERRDLVAKLEAFTAPTASVELSKGVLNPETLIKMADYLAQSRQAISEQDLQLRLERRDLEEQVALLQRQREQVAGGSAKTSREALVFVNLEKPGAKLQLRYLVNNATWSPSYNARAAADRKNVLIEYQASIQQMSGEDWSNVAMTLSTATPSLIAKAPPLEPLRLELVLNAPQSAAQYGQFDQEQYYKMRDELGQRLQAANVTRGKAAAADKKDFNTDALDASLNDLGCQMQVFEWASQGGMKKIAGRITRAPSEALSVTYQLRGRTSLPSRSDRQLIQIASTSMKGDFYRLAIPLLTDSVYEEATVTNAGGMVLLAGPVSTYMAGEFVGHGEIPSVAVGEKFTLGFGMDSSLRAGRELLEKTESLQGGNRIVDLTYRLTLENFGSQPVQVRLLDRRPMANGSDVKSTLLGQSVKLSDDPAYQQTELRKGVLRWDVQVPAQAVATSALTVEYQLRLEYDRQMNITGVAMAR